MKYLLIALSFSIFPIPAWSDMKAQRILESSDDIRNPGRSFRLRVDLSTYKNKKLAETSSLTLFSRIAPAEKQFRSLLRFTSPAKDIGKVTLKNGKDLWIYDPQSQATVPISPQQRLLGQASNGDVVTANWAQDYSASLLDEVEITDGDREKRLCHLLQLEARHGDATYKKILLWVDKEGYRSRKAQFFSESGSLLKTAYYRGYKPILGRDRPSETIIIDGVDPNYVTIMRKSEFAWADVPEAWLQRDYLPRFKAQ